MQNNSISIIIPNLNGQSQLARCLPAIEKLNYGRDDFECIVVDNHSVDGSLYFLKKYYPWVKTLELKKNLGFTGAINLASIQAEGDILVFLNNDAIPKSSDFLSRLVAPIVKEGITCTSAKILSIDGKRIQYAGGGMNFHGIAFQWGEGQLDHHKYNQPTTELFACGAAMAIDRQTFISCGKFDDDFFAYFEDVDLGWRLCKFGHQIRYTPDAIVYHQQSATSQFIDRAKIRVLHVRNPLLMIYKNYDTKYLDKIFPAAIMLSIRRMLEVSGVDDKQFRIDRETHLADSSLAEQQLSSIASPGQVVPNIALADMIAINEVLSLLPKMKIKHNEQQKKNKVGDESLFPLFRNPLRYAEKQPNYKLLHDQLIEQYEIAQIFK